MARYRGGDGHYADVECAYAQLEWYLVLSCNTAHPQIVSNKNGLAGDWASRRKTTSDKTETVGCLHVDHKFKLGGLLDGEIGRFDAAQ